jgi:UDP-N-acetyl-D-mannosaminuronic acid dehydrogenase
MDHDFDRDLAIIGAGRIGLPWGSVLAWRADRTVTCVDVDETLVEQINAAEAPFEEPGLEKALRSGVESGNLRATTEQHVVEEHRYVAVTINAPRNDMDAFLQTVRTYGEYLTDSHVFISRTTLPVRMIERTQEVIEGVAPGLPIFAVLPERLAEGKAIEEILSLPNIIGVDDEETRAAMESLLSPLETPLKFTDPATAMFVKLIDNSYRDGLFSISNQIAYIADVLGLDGHEAIQLANSDYPRNDIPSPGLVGGKCLPKDPHFLMDETICEQPTTPNLFSATRRTNASLPSYVATEVLKKQPKKVAILGITYKSGVGDTYNSPAASIRDIVASQGIEVAVYDPHVESVDQDPELALEEADVVVLATPHQEFSGAERFINKYSKPSAELYDVWGFLDESAVELKYDGFGIKSASAPEDPSLADWN